MVYSTCRVQSRGRFLSLWGAYMCSEQPFIAQTHHYGKLLLSSAVCYINILYFLPLTRRGRCMDRWTLGGVGKDAVTVAGDALHPMTPNLGQGGCTALEDSVVLARMLREAGGPGGSAEQLHAAVRRYEAERSARCLPLTVRSWAFGFALQIPVQPVCLVRDLFIGNLFSPAHFLDHTNYDCGKLL